MKSLYIAILLVCATLTGFAQTQKKTCELMGHVIDEASDEHLPYVTIYIKGTTTVTTTDATGHFVFMGLSEGSVTLVAKFMGYKTVEQTVTLAAGKTTELSITMAEEATDLNPVVVSANQSEVSHKRAPSVVNVLSPMMFESTNSNNLSQGLCYLTGIRVENSCQNCGSQQVRINGLDGQYSQILIDSRPIISALAGVYGIEQIPADMVDRVEVMRGGGSALYGSNAIGGTVNIITKEPLRNTGTLSTNIGLIDGRTPDISTNLNASLVSSDGKTGAYMFGNIKQRNAFDYDGDSYSELPELKGTTAGFRAYYKPTNRSKLTLEYHNMGEHRRGGDMLNLSPEDAGIAEQTDQTTNGGGVNYDLFSKDNKQKLSVYGAMQYIDRTSYYGGNDYSQPVGSTRYGGYGATTDLTFSAGSQYAYSFTKLWFMPASLIVGAEYSEDRLSDETPAYNRNIEQTAQTGSLLVQNEWKNDQLSILLGGRLDKCNLIDNPIFSPRVSLRYAPTDDIVFRAGYSTGFLSPQVYSEDLHVAAASGTLVLVELAPDLKPEHSQSYSLSADAYPTLWGVPANFLAEAFYTTLDDVFVLQDMGTNSSGYIIQEKVNGSGASVAGINLEAKLVFGKDYRLQAGFTCQQSKYKEPEAWSDTAEPSDKMLRTPNTYGYLTATCDMVKNLSLSLSGTYTGSMYIPHLAGYIAQDELVKTSTFFDASFKAAYTFNLQGGVKLQLNAGIQNIFNAYQKDFDQGANRDSNYIYGPIYPRGCFFGVKLSI